jgi:hypothetical protein
MQATEALRARPVARKLRWHRMLLVGQPRLIMLRCLHFDRHSNARPQRSRSMDQLLVGSAAYFDLPPLCEDHSQAAEVGLARKRRPATKSQAMQPWILAVIFMTMLNEIWTTWSTSVLAAMANTTSVTFTCTQCKGDIAATTSNHGHHSLGPWARGLPLGTSRATNLATNRATSPETKRETSAPVTRLRWMLRTLELVHNLLLPLPTTFLHFFDNTTLRVLHNG